MEMRQLLCGAARECITPPAELLPNLRGLKNHRFAGVIDDLFVRAIAIGNENTKALLLSFDLTQAPCTKEFLEELSAAADVPAEQLFFFSIHTHAAPFNTIDMEEREKQSDQTMEASEVFRTLLHRQALKAAKAAVAAMRPAKMGYAWGESCVNVVRLQEYTYLDRDGAPFRVCNLGADPSRPADRTLFTLRVEELETGKPIAFLVNYAMHNVATIWNDYDGSGAMGISSDIGGRISRFLEDENEGSVAVWSSGAAGDLNPLLLNETILPDPATGRTYEIVPQGCGVALHCLRVMSERHYADVKRVLRAVQCLDTDGTVAGAEEWSVTPGVDCIRHPGAPPEFRTGPDVPEHTVRMHMVKIGSLTLIGFGAELYSFLGKAILRVAPPNSVLITHDSSMICRSHYVLDDETIWRCDHSEGFAMVPGYDEYRHMAGVMGDDLIAHTLNMRKKVEEALTRATG